MMMSPGPTSSPSIDVWFVRVSRDCLNLTPACSESSIFGRTSSKSMHGDAVGRHVDVAAHERQDASAN